MTPSPASAPPSAGAVATGGTPAGLATATAPPVDCSALVPTPALTEGPYFTAGSPAKTDLREPGMEGTTLVVVGHVVDRSCNPVAGAVIDVWQADAAGTYDNAGYRLRGHLESGPDGSYRFTTIVPGLYPGRTEHIHVKVTPPGGPTLTTQLFFPGVSQNDEDGIFDAAGLLTITETPDGLLGAYTFVL
jgi:protocatechuate 3,4-dioxygenase beta subunit